MANWDDFTYSADTHTGGGAIKGKLRCVITEVEETESKNGNPMIVVTVKPSGASFTVKNYIVKGQYFNDNMSRFFDAFPEIKQGNFHFIEWVGCEGAAEFGEDDRGYTKIKWFLNPKQAEKLPAFVGDKPERQKVTSIGELTEASDDEDGELPF